VHLETREYWQAKGKAFGPGESWSLVWTEIRWRVRLGLMGRTGAKESTMLLEGREVAEQGERGKLGGS